MNSYEEKQEARRQRLVEAADNAASKAKSASSQAHRITEIIPLGQPILVGHHSEKRHRRDVGRANNLYQRAHDEAGKAAELRRRAEAVGTGGISSDDPDAVEKLEAQLQSLEAKQAMMKQANKDFRRGGWEAMNIPEGLIAKCKRDMELCPWIDVPFPSFALKNNNANTRRIRERIKELEERQANQDEKDHIIIETQKYRVVESNEDNRLQWFFSSKPSQDTCQLLKHSGWRWAPSVGAWQRNLNNASVANAQYVHGILAAEDRPSETLR